MNYSGHRRGEVFVAFSNNILFSNVERSFQRQFQRCHGYILNVPNETLFVVRLYQDRARNWWQMILSFWGKESYFNARKAVEKVNNKNLFGTSTFTACCDHNRQGTVPQSSFPVHFYDVRKSYRQNIAPWHLVLRNLARCMDMQRELERRCRYPSCLKTRHFRSLYTGILNEAASKLFAC